tara:strand:- start:149 stop:268 length:120 start_codon:yes stop_codon:yes gene_type:complete
MLYYHEGAAPPATQFSIYQLIQLFFLVRVSIHSLSLQAE